MTRLMVLGLLSVKPMSGYEIQSQLQVSQADKWAGILSGSIYHALKKLNEEGLVELDSVEQTGNRSKAIYKLTEAGREELILLLMESLQQSSVMFPTTLYTAMSFLYLLPAQEILQAIDRQRQTIEMEYEGMKVGKAAKEQAIRLPDYIELTFDNVFEQYELQLRFLDRLKTIIEQKGVEHP